MSAASTLALSGLRAAQTRLDVAANNVANVQTPGFRRHSVATVSQPSGGVMAWPVPGTAAVGSGAALLGDLTTDLVEQRVARYAFEANLLVLRTDEQMQGRLLDVMA
jgi:flagellar hook protein FlgE